MHMYPTFHSFNFQKHERILTFICCIQHLNRESVHTQFSESLTWNTNTPIYETKYMYLYNLNYNFIQQCRCNIYNIYSPIHPQKLWRGA